MGISGLGFSSAPTVASGPFQWRITAHRDDRVRLLLHQSIIRPTNALRLRGGLTASRLLQRAVGSYRHALAAESDDVRMSFDGFDRYWMATFFRGDFYERELYRLFRNAQGLGEFDFIDGGANIGFWSAVLTSAEFGIRRAVALEASPTTFANLARTATLCGGRFVALHRALTSMVGEVTFEQGKNHESRHIVSGDQPDGRQLVTVEATTVDNLVISYELNPSKLIVKLDVEGAEMDCIRGARTAFSQGAIFIYEDHGKDPASTLTENLLDHGAACWFIDDEGQLVPIHTSAAASAFKLDRKRGYNFLCTRRDGALERVASTFQASASPSLVRGAIDGHP